MTNKDSQLHIGINYNEAVSSKKHILLSESGMLNIIKHMRTYSALRNKEFILKGKVQRVLTSVKTSIISIDNELPKSESLSQEETKANKKEINLSEREVALIEKAKSQKEKQETPKKIQELRKNREIEAELAEINEKLAQLG